MSTFVTTIRIAEDLASIYDRLAEATGRSREHLIEEALRDYASAEIWQLEQVRETLARLQVGTRHMIPGQHVVGGYLAKGWMTQEGLNEARQHDGAPARESGFGLIQHVGHHRHER